MVKGKYALIFAHYRCEACEKDWPAFSSMPKISGKEMVKLMKAANLFGPKNGEMLRKFEHFCNFAIPADNEMLPRMVALLGEFHKTGTRMNHWFYMMQESIKNHYRTQGSGFFFGDSEEILLGNKKFDVKEASKKINERLENGTMIVTPFGLMTSYLK